MKDHIDRLEAIKELALAAGRHPHLRIGQLIVGAITPGWAGDPWLITDEELRDVLKAFGPTEAK